jgi:hypothetical protein
MVCVSVKIVVRVRIRVWVSFRIMQGLWLAITLEALTH